MSAELYGWEHCSHEGIGMPGCPICDPVRSRVVGKAVWDEREACAKVARTEAANWRESGNGDPRHQVAAGALEAVADLILARGVK